MFKDIDHQLCYKQFEMLDELLSRSISKVTGKRIDLPCFDGVDPSNWILRAEEYFDFHETFDEQRARLVAFNMSGEGAEWYQLMKSGRMLRSWSDFKEKVMLRFGNSQLGDGFEDESSYKNDLLISSDIENTPRSAFDSSLKFQVEILVEESPILSYVLDDQEEQIDGLAKEQEDVKPHFELFEEDCQGHHQPLKLEIADVHIHEQDKLLYMANYCGARNGITCFSIMVFKLVATCSYKQQKEIEHEVIKSVGNGDRGTSYQRRMVLKFYTLKEIYWELMVLLAPP